MNTNIILSLDTRRAKKGGVYPLVLRLGHNGKTVAIPTGYDLKEKDWNEEQRIVKPSYGGVSSVARLNNLLQAKKKEASDIIVKLDEAGQLRGMSVLEVKQCIVRKNEGGSFFSFAEQVIEEMRKANRHGTADINAEVLGILKTYHGSSSLTFENINYKFLTKFETHHIAKGNSLNGLAVYMRTIRAIYNKAIKAKIIDKDLYPFDDYKIKTQPTQKRALNREVLQKIIKIDIAPEHRFFDVRNYFLASYMMYGMNYADMAHLKKESLAGGRVNYRRKKSRKLYDIKIVPQLEAILSHYMNLNPESDYVFPILKRDNTFDQHKDVKWARKRYNKKLKELAQFCGIDENLTSYVSRHTFATLASIQEIPVAAISSMLGHGSIKTTEVYLKGLPTNMLDDYSDRIYQQ